MADGGGDELEAGGGLAPVFDGRGGSGELGASGGSAPALPRPRDLMTTSWSSSVSPVPPFGGTKSEPEMPAASTAAATATAVSYALNVDVVGSVVS